LNLRYCLEVCGANTTYARTLIDPRDLRTPFFAHAHYYNEPNWIKNNFGKIPIRETIPIKPLPRTDFGYYWQARLPPPPNRRIRDINSINERLTPEQQYFSNPNLDSMPILPSISNPAYNMSPYIVVDNSPRKDPIAVKEELYDRVAVDDMENEMRALKSRLRRMESLLQSKNSRIQELLFELEKTKYKKPKP
jgi:hypothetical protein